MKDRKQQAERLSDGMGLLEEDLLEEARRVDSPEKLRQCRQIRCGNKKQRTHRQGRFSSPAFHRIAAVAACFMLIACFMIPLPLFLPSETVNTTRDSPPGSTPDSVPGWMPSDPAKPKIVFDTLDKVNYYAGMRVIGGVGNSVPENRSGSLSQSPSGEAFGRSLTGGLVTVLAASPRPLLAPVSLDREDQEETLPPDSAMPGEGEDVTPVVGFEDISGERLTVTTAVYFCAEVTEADTFLAEKIGTGRVDVVMTDLHIGPNPYSMITFKKGDAYFSCVSEGSDLQTGENTFFTHLYVRGLRLYKDTTQGILTLRVYQEEATGTVTSLSWSPYNRIPSQAPVFFLTVHPETTKISHEVYAFTLTELDEYYNSDGKEDPLAHPGEDSMAHPDETVPVADPGTASTVDPGTETGAGSFPDESLTVRLGDKSVQALPCLG